MCASRLHVLVTLLSVNGTAVEDKGGDAEGATEVEEAAEEAPVVMFVSLISILFSSFEAVQDYGEAPTLPLDAMWDYKMSERNTRTPNELQGLLILQPVSRVALRFNLET